MTAFLPDSTIDHLRDVAEWPDLGDRYVVTGRLGRGGMSAVFAAVDRTLGRQVAVKVLDLVAPSHEVARRLGREARIMARLEHPGIVPVHDAGALPDGRVYYVMKLVRGTRLHEAMADEATVADRVALVSRVCDAVAFAHAQGIVHRDLKPENVMLGPFGDVLVMDWGVASVLSDASPEPLVAGTPGYMAPEQAAGGAVDPRADVYGLGAMLRAIIPEPLPPRLAAIATRATAPEPADRYQTVTALTDDLARFRNGEPVEAYRETLAERAMRVVSRYRVPIAVVLAYVVMRAALILWFGR
jgi:serine/threonine protein kinase